MVEYPVDYRQQEDYHIKAYEVLEYDPEKALHSKLPLSVKRVEQTAVCLYIYIVPRFAK